MDRAIGLLGLLLYMTAVLGFAAGVTYVVVRLTPDRAKKKAAAEEDA
jgi:hypothetical protein